MQSPGCSDNSSAWCLDFTCTTSGSPDWVCHLASVCAFAGRKSWTACLSLSGLSAVPCHEIGLSSTVYCCRDWETAYKELEMQRGYCSVATRYSPGLVRQQAFSSPEAALKVVCGSSSLFSLGLLMLVSALGKRLAA